MSPSNRIRVDALKAKARTDDEDAVNELRFISIKLCCDAPVETLIKVVEAFNDVYVDEQIEWGITEAASALESKTPVNELTATAHKQKGLRLGAEQERSAIVKYLEDRAEEALIQGVVIKNSFLCTIIAKIAIAIEEGKHRE